jgi:hypothetical protein
MLNQGKDGIEQMRAEAEKLGLTLDTSMAHQAERVNDNFTRMRGVLQGLIIRVVDGLLPTLENLTNMFAEFSSNQKDAAAASETLATALKLLVSAGVVVQSVFKVLGDTIAMVAAAISFVVNREFRAAFEVLKQGAGDVLGTVQGTMERLERVWDSAAEEATRTSHELAGAQRTVGEAFSFTTGKVQEQTDELKEWLNLQRAMRDSAPWHLMTDPWMRQGQGATEAQRRMAEQLKRDRLQQIKDELDEAQRMMDEHNAKEDQRLQDKLDAQKKAAEEWQRVWQNATDRVDALFVDLWANLFRSTKDFLEGLKNIFLRTLAEMAHMAITRPILISFMGALGGALGIPGAANAAGGIAGGGLLAGIGGKIGGLFGGGSAAALGPEAAAFGYYGAGAAGSAGLAVTAAGIATAALPILIGGAALGLIAKEIFGKSSPLPRKWRPSVKTDTPAAPATA